MARQRIEWFHIACVYDSQKQEVYLNGELAAERDWPGFIGSSHSPVKIGTFHTQYWPGMLDEIRIWNRARTHEEIRSTMNAPLTGTEPRLGRVLELRRWHRKMIYPQTGITVPSKDLPRL